MQNTRIMLNFISFGSGSSGNCYYFYSEADSLMVDIGVGLRTLKKHFGNYGLRMRDIQNVIVTHDHADHIKSAGSISKDLNIPVYATALTHKGIERNYCVRTKVPEANKRVIEPGKTFGAGPFEITPFHVPHDSFDCVGYHIVYHGIHIVLATDVGTVTDEMRRAIGQAHYLIIEANHDVDMLKNGPYSAYLKQRVAGPTGHMSNATCGQVVAECATDRLRHIWLCHLSEENNHPELARITVEQALTEKGIMVGEDLQLDVLKRKVPTGAFELKAVSGQDADNILSCIG